MRLDNKTGNKIIIPNNDAANDVNPFAKLEEAQKKAMEEKIDDVLEPLKALEEMEKSKVPVEYFRSTFANKFQDMIDNKTSDEKTVRSWLKIAGGGQRDVDLIDDEGKVVDTVPRILSEIPPLEEIDNRKVKTMAQMVVLDSENQNGSVNFFADAENRQHLSGIGLAISKAVLTYEPNIVKAAEFRNIVSKYSNKLTDEQIQEKVESTKPVVDEIEYIID